VEFQQAPAEDTGLPDGSVDLVTTAQALHWWALPHGEPSRLPYASLVAVCCNAGNLLMSSNVSLTVHCDRFDLQRFYAEAHRVLRPGGVLATWGYDLIKLNDEDADTCAMHWCKSHAHSRALCNGALWNWQLSRLAVRCRRCRLCRRG
jgi:SAM-dependent methyltransferase